MKQVVPFILFVLATLKGVSQCDAFVKQQCVPRLGDYTDIGKRNIAVLLPGDTAEIGVTFYSTHHYRVVVGATPELGKLTFRLLDRKGSVLFDSKAYNSPQQWDFNTQATQNVTIQVIVPKVAATQVAQTGCVGVLIGFKGDSQN